MLDQENQAGVDQTTPASQTTNKQQNNNISNSNSSNNNNNNNADNQSINSTLVNNNPSLFEHDYCSPNKGLSPNMHQSSQAQMDSDKDQRLNAATDCIASTSSPPNSTNNGGSSVIVFGQSSALPETKPIASNFNDDDSSDSSLSLSSSDASSSKDLVIAQDSHVTSTKPHSLAPKDTPSVSRPKLGRRPMLKKEMALDSPRESAHKHQERVRRPRQNTSVTDKSQWITGDEQIDSALSEHLDTSGREKRKRKELHDPEFSHFTSSEYSSSEAESEDDSGGDSEDDPKRPWCDCNKPHNGEFMIECDICKYWFHGRCVGVTEAMSSKYEAQGKEWFCPDCHNQLLNGTERNAIPLRLVKKEKKKTSIKSNRTGKRGRGRPRKSEPVREIIRMSTRNSRKSTSTIEKFGVKRKMDVRSESFEEFENNEKLKMLIRERKKQFFYKRSLAEQQKRAKMQELGLSRQSVTTPSLGNSLDSLATSTSTPNMSNLPINIKSDHKERSKPNIVLQINTKKDGSSDQDNQRIVTAIVKTKKRKHQHSETKANDPCWSGLMNVPDVGKFSVSAKAVSGNLGFMKEELGQNLVVCGRIAPDQVTSYIKKLKSKTKNQVLLIQLHPQADEDKPNFDIFFDYLYSRNRCAVITTGTSSHILKDFYILPIHETSNIPEVLKPINGPGLDRKGNPNCLLGLLVKSKRSASASSSPTSCTSTPINK